MKKGFFLIVYISKSLPYRLILNSTLEYNHIQCNIVHFAIFWLLEYSKNGQSLIKSHLNFNWTPSKNLFWKIEPWGSIWADTVVTAYYTLIIYILQQSLIFID